MWVDERERTALAVRATRNSLQPRLTGDEHIVLYSQGGYKDNPRSAWKLGQFHLTSDRLIFSVPTGILFQVALTNMESIDVEQARFALGKWKDVIAIGYQRPTAPRAWKAWIIMRDLEVWRKKLFEMALLEIDQETIDRVMQELDWQGRGIVSHLWEARHATIDELAELIGASTHMDVLLKIRGDINPTAERIAGSPILTFRRSRVDPVTGEKVLFSWWVIGPPRAAAEARTGVLVDVFDEGDRIDVVAELAGVREEDLVLTVARDTLTLHAEGPEGKYHEEIVLPAEVRVDTLTRTYTNNVLAISLEKLA
ncbi:MAG: Hsp20/alpha crystallin family protein [Dehalococcoidia bacterium]|nr:Hsp20/alpha crystallin family protein [Dehalococcoidia bacterium]